MKMHVHVDSLWPYYSLIETSPAAAFDPALTRTIEVTPEQLKRFRRISSAFWKMQHYISKGSK